MPERFSALKASAKDSSAALLTSVVIIPVAAGIFVISAFLGSSYPPSLKVKLNPKSTLCNTKSNVSIDKKEEKVFELIDRLERGINQVFDEVLELNTDSIYKVPNLSYRLTELTSLLDDTYEAYDYLHTIGLEDYQDATRRLQLKRMLATTVSIWAFLSNPLLGIGSFILLNNKANKDYALEIESIDEFTDKYDDERIERIVNTLSNTCRIFNGKVIKLSNKVKEIEESQDKNDVLTLVASECIELYVSGKMDNSFVEDATDELKNKIISTLKRSLKSYSTDINELLELEKIHNEDSVKLIKEYKKN